MNNPAATYHRLSIESASPISLIVMLYERAIIDLHEAITAIEQGNIEQRTTHLNHFYNILNHLECSLDYRRGGHVAESLANCYRHAKRQSLAAAVRNSKDILIRLADDLLVLRDAWQKAEQILATADTRTNEKAGNGNNAVSSAGSGEVLSPHWTA